MGRPSTTSENIWKKIIRRTPDKCWPWKGPKNGGYGRFQKDGHNYYAHRVIYSISNPGSIEWCGPAQENTKTGVFVLHTCDNPVCCNPKHLVLGTHADNMQHKVERKRCPDFSAGKGPRCKLTMEDVFWIKMHYKYGVRSKALRTLYGVCQATINGVLSGRHYKEAPK